MVLSRMFDTMSIRLLLYVLLLFALSIFTLQRIIQVLLTEIGADRLSFGHFALRLVHRPLGDKCLASDTYWLHNDIDMRHVIARYINDHDYSQFKSVSHHIIHELSLDSNYEFVSSNAISKRCVKPNVLHLIIYTSKYAPTISHRSHGRRIT